MAQVFKSLLLLVSLFSTTAFAKSFDVELQMNVYGEYLEIDNEELASQGWEAVEDDYGNTNYEIKISVAEAQLPYSISVGDAWFSISKEGEISLNISVGDSDATADGSVTWPKDASGNFINIGAPLVLQASGGDHASGMWSFGGKATVTLRD